MPDLLKKRCGFRGCPKTTRQCYCDEHAPLARRFYDRRRGSSADRGYDSAWERIAEHRRQLDCGLETMRKLMVAFGLTLSSRSRIRVPAGGDEVDELDRFLNAN